MWKFITHPLIERDFIGNSTSRGTNLLVSYHAMIPICVIMSGKHERVFYHATACHSMPQQYKMSVSNLVTSLAMGKDFKGECAVLSFVLSRAKRWMFIWTRINLSFFTSPSAYNPCCAPFPRWTSLIQQLFTVSDKETLGSSPARSLWTQTYFRLGNTSAFAG